MQHGLFLVPFPNKAARVHVNCSERFCVVNNDMAAGFEGDASVERFGNLRLNFIVLKDRRLFIVELHAAGQTRHEGRDEFINAFVIIRIIDNDLIDIRREHIANDTQDDVHIVVHEGWGCVLLTFFGDPAPEFEQEFHVVVNLFFGQTFTRGADNKTALGGSQADDRFSEPAALFAVRNAPGHTDMFYGRCVHQLSSGQREVGGESGTFRPDRLFGHLDQNFLILLQFLFEWNMRPRTGSTASLCGSGLVVWR